MAALGALTVLGAAQAADNYPSRPITMVVPVPPGGAADFIARVVGSKLSDALGQPVVISNRPGASGIIASDSVAKAAPDGYTLLLNSITTHGIGPHLYAHLPYDPVKDFTPVILVASLPLIMTINTKHPEKSVQEVVAYAKAHPRTLTFASSGNGGAPHLAGALFQDVTGTKMLHVPYRGSGPAVVDMAAGRVDIMFDAVPSLLAMIQAGKLRPLAAASAVRNSVVPDVPTFDELGIKGMEVSLWYGLEGPANLPKPVLQRLNGALAKILSTDDIKTNFAKEGAVPQPDSPRDFATFMRDESARWGAVVRKNDIKIE
ncbi:MAG TPA: tripartite tricarboxylate transporter substrate binding protein [Pseudolabrys sp.]|nr:tripartite tricarboxylate transporter substrate binding protein [Pseudolabrys sp.]